MFNFNRPKNTPPKDSPLLTSKAYNPEEHLAKSVSENANLIAGKLRTVAEEVESGHWGDITQGEAVVTHQRLDDIDSIFNGNEPGDIRRTRMVITLDFSVPQKSDV